MKGEILKLLKESDGYLSGQELCERFGVSRTAVWKVINQLKEEGYEIEAVRNKGYILKSVSDVLSKEELESSLKTRWAGKEILYFDRTDSTNIQARLAGEAGASHGTLAVAEIQDGGRGRRGRSWVSPAGVGIWMSLLLRPEIPHFGLDPDPGHGSGSPEGHKEATGIESQIKWPNDLVLNKKKICGILTEMGTEFMEIKYVVMGTGINVNQEGFPEELRENGHVPLSGNGEKVPQEPDHRKDPGGPGGVLRDLC